MNVILPLCQDAISRHIESGEFDAAARGLLSLSTIENLPIELRRDYRDQALALRRLTEYRFEEQYGLGE